MAPRRSLPVRLLITEPVPSWEIRRKSGTDPGFPGRAGAGRPLQPWRGLAIEAAGGRTHTLSQRLVLVGGNGDLAGASIVAGDWSGETMVHLILQGAGTLYSEKPE